MSTEQARMDPAQGPELSNTTAETTSAASAGAPGAAPADLGGDSKGIEPNLAEELRAFGKQLETMFHTARTSTRGKELEQQLTAAWRDVEKGINHTITSAQATDLKGTVSGTAQYAADEVQGGLARGLRSFNQWLASKLDEIEERRKQREQAISNAATQGTGENEVTDRFGANEPVFGTGTNVPASPVHITPDVSAGHTPTSIITERFDDEPPKST